jgi:hypothetical protein
MESARQTVLLIPFALERNVTILVVLSKAQRRPRDAGQRWRLVEVPIEATEDPVQLWNLHGDTDTWVNGVLGNGPLKVRLPLSCDQGQPVGGLVVVLDE